MRWCAQNTVARQSNLRPKSAVLRVAEQSVCQQDDNRQAQQTAGVAPGIKRVHGREGAESGIGSEAAASDGERTSWRRNGSKEPSRAADRLLLGSHTIRDSFVQPTCGLHARTPLSSRAPPRRDLVGDTNWCGSPCASSQRIAAEEEKVFGRRPQA
mgnify:CR=1 FL=1